MWKSRFSRRAAPLLIRRTISTLSGRRTASLSHIELITRYSNALQSDDRSIFLFPAPYAGVCIYSTHFRPWGLEGVGGRGGVGIATRVSAKRRGWQIEKAQRTRC